VSQRPPNRSDETILSVAASTACLPPSATRGASPLAAEGSALRGRQPRAAQKDAQGDGEALQQRGEEVKGRRDT
jgi:hypothetical protein